MPKAQRYDCALQQERHYEYSREYVLHHLGKNTYLNGNQFAIIWISSSGEVETYASQGVLDGMRRWFNDDVMQEARDLTEEAYRKTRPPRCACSTDHQQSAHNASSSGSQLGNQAQPSAACAAEAIRADRDIAALCQFENGVEEGMQHSAVASATAVPSSSTAMGNQKRVTKRSKKQRGSSGSSKDPTEMDEDCGTLNIADDVISAVIKNGDEDEDEEEDCDTDSQDILKILQVPVPTGIESSNYSPNGRQSINPKNIAAIGSNSNNKALVPRTPHPDLLHGPNTNFLINSAPPQFNAHKRNNTMPADPNSAEYAMHMIFAPVDYKLPYDCDSNNVALKSKIIPSGDTLAAVWRVPAANIHAYFRLRFMQLQQIICKLIAKTWIKVVEPKKQSRFPYKDGDTRRPDWWPANARHKEPDHLKKPERISLLLSILTSPLCTTNLLELSTLEIEDMASPEKLATLRELYRTNREYERRRRVCPDMIGHDYEVYVAVGTPPIEAVGFKVSGTGPDFCTTRGGKRKRTFPVLYEADTKRIGSSIKWPPQPLFINTNDQAYNLSNSQNNHSMAQSAPPSQTMFNLDFDLQTGQPLNHLTHDANISNFLKNNTPYNPPPYSGDLNLLSRQWQGSVDDLSMPSPCPQDLVNDMSAYATSLPTPPISARPSQINFSYHSVQRSYSSPNGMPQINNLSMVGNDMNHAYPNNTNNFYSMVPSNLSCTPLSPPRRSVKLSDIA